MMDGQILAFMVAITLLTMAPGPDTVMVTRNAIRGGRRDGVITGMGICSGLFVHALISAGGLSLILLGSAHLFQMVKLAGAAYLIWLGLQNLYAAFRGQVAAPAFDGAAHQVSVRRSLREGILSSVLNPKLAVFYMAFLPQFMNPAGNLVLQALVLAMVHVVITFIWLGSLAVMVDKARALLTTPRVTRWIDGIVGSLLTGFGLRLAVSD